MISCSEIKDIERGPGVVFWITMYVLPQSSFLSGCKQAYSQNPLKRPGFLREMRKMDCSLKKHQGKQTIRSSKVMSRFYYDISRSVGYIQLRSSTIFEDQPGEMTGEQSKPDQLEIITLSLAFPKLLTLFVKLSCRRSTHSIYAKCMRLKKPL